MQHAAYRERRPAADLAADVVCTWTGWIATDGRSYTDRVLPDGCVDLVWDGTGIVVAGPDTGPVELAPRPGTVFTGIRFRPGRAPAAVGLPASAVRDQRPALADVWGAPAATALAERLAAADSAAAAEDLLAQAVRERLTTADPHDTLVDAAVTALASVPHARPGLIADLAAHLGVTERSLHRRCTAAVGYGPKTLERVLRFRRALALAAATGATIGAVAASAGYADQAHLTRECRRLSGRTPSELFKTHA